MVSLLQHMDHPIPLNQVQVGLMDDPQINAANAGGGHFYVTTGLLEKANDDQLRGVMAHETAHADLGHVAKAQRLRTGLGVGMILLNQVIPSTSAITPIAGQLIANSYSRKEEHQADAHGVEILQRGLRRERPHGQYPDVAQEPGGLGGPRRVLRHASSDGRSHRRRAPPA
jgi:metalloprotease